MIFVNIVWALVILVCLIVLFVVVGFQPMTKNVEKWCEMRKTLSNNRKEIELRRLEVLEKTPELRQLIFHPKIIENEK